MSAGNVTTTTYGPCCDQPATITDAQSNTTCYRYDERGRNRAMRIELPTFEACQIRCD